MLARPIKMQTLWSLLICWAWAVGPSAHATGICEASTQPEGIRPPVPLDLSTVKSGDVIGFSRFIAQTPLIIQAVTGSPIDHVVIAAETPEGLRFYDVINVRTGGKVVGMDPRKLTWDELTATSQASRYWFHARPRVHAGPGLTELQKSALYAALEQVVARQVPMPGSCSILIRDALKAAGLDVGFLIENGVDEFLEHQEAMGAAAARRAFHGFPAKAWADQLASTKVMVPNSSLFEVGSDVLAHSLPYELEAGQHPAIWSLRQQWRVWTAIGDTKSVAREFWSSLPKTHPLKAGPKPDSDTLDGLFRAIMNQWFAAEDPAVLDAQRPLFSRLRR